MDFDSQVLLAALAVTGLLFAASACGSPTATAEEPIVVDQNAVTTTTVATVRGGVRGWLKDVKNRIDKMHEHHKDCGHVGVIGWVKNKLGFAKKPADATATPPFTTDATAEDHQQPGNAPEPMDDGAVDSPSQSGDDVPSPSGDAPSPSGDVPSLSGNDVSESSSAETPGNNRDGDGEIESTEGLDVAIDPRSKF